MLMFQKLNEATAASLLNPLVPQNSCSGKRQIPAMASILTVIAYSAGKLLTSVTENIPLIEHVSSTELKNKSI